MSETNQSETGYLHGYSAEEQKRLYDQARFLEKGIYDTIDLSGHSRILEVGCGVGAQTEILLERYPGLSIEGIDFSPAQIACAEQRLSGAIRDGRVKLQVGDARKLPYAENSFDGAFCCWFLEHVDKPVEILREIGRVLEPGGALFCNEVLNSSFFLHPYSPATLQYWFQFNDYQWTIKGDPFVGAKLGNYLSAAGFQTVATHIKHVHYDNRAPKRRAQMFDYWTRLLLSGTPALLEAKRVTAELVEEMKEELKRLKSDPDAVFFFTWFQAKAQAF